MVDADETGGATEAWQLLDDDQLGVFTHLVLVDLLGDGGVVALGGQIHQSLLQLRLLLLQADHEAVVATKPFQVSGVESRHDVTVLHNLLGLKEILLDLVLFDDPVTQL